MLKRILLDLLNTDVFTNVIVDSKDLHSSLSSKRNTVDKSICPDVNSMRFYFDTVIDVFARILGSITFSDVWTKLKAPLTDVLILKLANCVLQFDLH